MTTVIIRIKNGKQQWSVDDGKTWTSDLNGLRGRSFNNIIVDEWLIPLGANVGQMTRKDTNAMFNKDGRVIGFDTEPQASQAFTLEYCEYMGKRCRVISKNYQDGTATIEAQDLTGPYTIVVQLAALKFNDEAKKSYGQKCTCGVSSVGNGKHSEWCDIYNSWD